MADYELECNECGLADYELECNECGWQGRESALENQTVESGAETFNFCPDCGGSDFEKVTEEEEQDSPS
jgi:Zn finger protein HypA/HybF involved in hydrogenase expression